MWLEILSRLLESAAAPHHHALCQQVDERLPRRDDADVVEEMTDEACVVQVHDCCDDRHTNTQTYIQTDRHTDTHTNTQIGWLHGTVVERCSLIGELSLSCALPAADG